MDVAQVLERFAAYAREEQTDPAEGALLIAARFDPAVDIEHERGLFDAMALGVRERMPLEASPLASVNVLNEYLFDELGFAGNEGDYYDPANSLVHVVLRRRLGIPISLAVVYLAVGRRNGVPLAGVGMPGHFMVRHQAEPDLFIDPFHRGIVRSAAECQELLRRIAPQVRWEPSFLNAVSDRGIVARMLRNLSAIYVKQNRLAEAVGTLDLLILLQPGEEGHLRDRGMLHHRMGEDARALDDLDAYLRGGMEPADAWFVRRIATQIRERGHHGG
jgi:regulator of sirC expression with transglutaminase-like and TPR domain